MRSENPTPSNKDNHGCFLPGTLIRMADGAAKPIEEIQVGDYIISYDPERRIPIEADVLEVETLTRKDYYVMALEDWHDLRLADDHPLFIRRNDYEGWSAIDPAGALASTGMTVEALRVGDEALTYDGWIRIATITRVEEETQAYNLKRISPGSTFFAGDVLVHNKG